mmetsp:Transcript_809/g.1174  ORF Transcript_809/g.1174 Transcript_809/m.1174 type:complete len:212 (+) Transcript_809:1492-2127(+)
MDHHLLHHRVMVHHQLTLKLLPRLIPILHNIMVVTCHHRLRHHMVITITPHTINNLLHMVIALIMDMHRDHLSRIMDLQVRLHHLNEDATAVAEIEETNKSQPKAVISKAVNLVSRVKCNMDRIHHHPCNLHQWAATIIQDTCNNNIHHHNLLLMVVNTRNILNIPMHKVVVETQQPCPILQGHLSVVVVNKNRNKHECKKIVFQMVKNSC